MTGFADLKRYGFYLVVGYYRRRCGEMSSSKSYKWALKQLANPINDFPPAVMEDILDLWTKEDHE